MLLRSHFKISKKKNPEILQNFLKLTSQHFPTQRFLNLKPISFPLTFLPSHPTSFPFPKSEIRRLRSNAIHRFCVATGHLRQMSITDTTPNKLKKIAHLHLNSFIFVIIKW